MAANTNNFLDDTNTTLVFLEGNHTLDTDLNMTDINHFVRLFATNLVSVSITCTDRAGLYFNNIAQLQINGLELIKCRNRIEYVPDFLLEDCHFRDGDSDSALLLAQTNTNIERCSFVSNRGTFIILISHCSIGCYLRIDRAGGALFVTNSSSHFDSNEAGAGGAIYILMRSNISITDCTFVNNKAVDRYSDGGALHVSGSTVAVHNSTFMNNSAAAGNRGGAAFLDGAVFHDYQNIFHGNRAWRGGAIDTTDSIITVDSSYYSNNTSVYGGAVFAKFTSIAINHSSFYHNSANYEGGAFYSMHSDITVYCSSINNNKAGNSGGGIRSSHSNIALHYSTFTNNEAVTNGEVMLEKYSSIITVYSSSLDNNKTGRHGGVVHMENSSIAMTYSSFSDNQAGNDGGVVHAYDSNITVNFSSFDDNQAGNDGGVVHAYDSNITVNFSSFDDNQAGNDGGVIYEWFTYTILYENSFRSNKAGNSGGVLYKSNSLTTSSSDSIAIVPIGRDISTILCTFVNNSAEEGGVMYIHDALLTDMTSKYENNRVTINGGAISLNKGGMKVTASSFIRNTAINNGGVASTLIHWFQNHMTFQQCHFQHNRAFSGGVIAVVASDLVTVSTSMFTNNSAVRGGVVYLLSGNKLTVAHSTFSQNSTDSDGGVFYSTD